MAREDAAAPVTFEVFQGEAVSTEKPTVEFAADAPVDLRIELGRAQLGRDEAAHLSPGAVVPLDKRAGDPVDIHADGRLVARGQLVAMEGKFCVRVTELVLQMKACA